MDTEHHIILLGTASLSKISSSPSLAGDGNFSRADIWAHIFGFFPDKNVNLRNGCRTENGHCLLRTLQAENYCFEGY